MQIDKNGRNCRLFRIDVYFNQFLLAVDIDEKGHINRDLIFKEKRQEGLGKKISCKFIRINTSNSKNSYDFDYEVGNIEAFIDEFKDRQLEKEKFEKKSNKKIKELEEKNKNSTRNQITNNFEKIIIKN